MIPTDTSNLDAAAPATRPPSPEDAWLSRRHWRRAVRRWALGALHRSELEALKTRLSRVRAGDAAPSHRTPAPPPALRLLRGGRASRPPGTPPTAPGGPARAA